MTDLSPEKIRRSPKEPMLSQEDWLLPADPWLSQAKLKKVEHTRAVCDRIKESRSEPASTIIVAEGLEFTVPARFNELAEQIRQSAYILEYEDNWDDEGSIAYSKQTYRAAINFAIKYSKEIWEEEFVLIDTPKILPGPEGSIDLLWDKQTYRLLINVHPHPKQTASFYGDNRTSVPKIKGDFRLSDESERAIMLLLKKAKR